MCGICGVHDPAGHIDLDLVRRMNEVLRHRGPDAEAVKPFNLCGLAYTRLSIIDLPTGFQPMADESGSRWIVYNGEIYNYRRLRDDLAARGHELKTHSDTETIIHLYEERREGLLPMLNGMFAFAIWDDSDHRLFLARDRLGIKPLYYTEQDGRIAFASEIKSLLEDETLTRKLNAAALADYLTFQNIFGDKTFFEGIHLLPPGHYLTAKDGKIEVRRYWDLHFSPGVGTEEEAVGELRRLLDESVEMQLMSDVPLGSHLSGGLDSGTIVMKASEKLAEPLQTFSVYFEEPEVDESRFIEAVAEFAHSVHHGILLDPKEFLEVLPKIAYQLDEPRLGPGVIPQWFIARLAADHVKVVLTGHGGDELFAGYPSYVIPYLRDVWRRRDLGEAKAILANLRQKLREEGWKRIVGIPLMGLVSRDLWTYGRQATFREDQLDKLLTPAMREVFRRHEPRRELDAVLSRCDAESELDRVLYLDIMTYLPSLLLVEDRISMGHSLEDRVPILDHRIAELSALIPGRLKIRGLDLKHLLRRHAKGLLPREVLEHRKIGFLVPLGEWMRGPLRSFVEETLLCERARARGIFQPEAVEALVRAHLRGKKDLSWQLWTLLNVELWHRTWIDSAAAPPSAG